MMIERIDPETLKKTLSAGARYLEINSRLLDNLNVFPVPDGDTGLNMVATICAAIDEVARSSASSMREISDRLVRSFSESSRGNSGFLLSRFFDGFFRFVRDFDYIDRECLVAGFSNGSFAARAALLTPVEGTMITVISTMVNAMEDATGPDIVCCIKSALDAASKVIKETPAMLPVLARAGVVDSGGLGFLFLVKGIYRGLTGGSPEAENEREYRDKPREEVKAVSSQIAHHRFCVELTVSLRDEIGEAELKSKLKELGNSIALVRWNSELKLHIHTDAPESVTSLFLGKGEIVGKKIDDIGDQVSLFTAVQPHLEAVSVFAIVPGEGFARMFSDLGAKKTLVYGDRLPSTGEILRVLEDLDGENVLLLPNERNIIASAMSAAEQSNAQVVIVPSRNVVQGISAMCAYLVDEPLEENIASMTSCLEDGLQIRCYSVVKDSSFGPVTLHIGEYFTVLDDEVLSSGTDPVEVIANALELVGVCEGGSLTIFFRDDESEKPAADIAADLRERYHDLEIEHIAGGQTGALFILAVS